MNILDHLKIIDLQQCIASWRSLTIGIDLLQHKNGILPKTKSAEFSHRLRSLWLSSQPFRFLWPVMSSYLGVLSSLSVYFLSLWSQRHHFLHVVARFIHWFLRCFLHVLATFSAYFSNVFYIFSDVFYRFWDVFYRFLDVIYMFCRRFLHV